MFDIMKKKWIFFGIAIALSVISLVSLVFQGFNLDTDFSGGLAMTYEIADDFSTVDLEALASEALGANKAASSIQKSGNDVIIKVGYDKNMTDDERAAYSTEVKTVLTEALEAKYGKAKVEGNAAPEATTAPEGAATEATAAPDGAATTAPDLAAATEATTAPDANAASLTGTLTSGVRLKSLDDISPSSGQELARSAMWMSLLACAGILLYVTIRFEFTSGCVAIVALIHDVLLLCGIYSLFRISVNINFIAAVLTVLGYSINNTIVIMDRIRENTRRSRKETYGEIANASIWQTMNRSINTTITTLLTIGMVFILGVPSIQAFAMPIILGIFIGFLSSVFISGPLWATWKDAGVKASGKARASK